MRHLPLQSTAVLVLLAARAGAAQAPICYNTPEEAARQTQPGAGLRTGFRLLTQRWDPVLGRRWATVASCDHPEEPVRTVALDGPGPALGPTANETAPYRPPMVMAGDRVRVVYREEMVQMEFAAVAQTSGNLGDRIRARIQQPPSAAAGGDRYLSGIVRGPHAVEMQP
jgi:hypothetical protein